MTTIQKLLCCGVFLVWYSCEQDTNITKLQYMPDMVDAPIVKAYRGYLDPPEGSVAINALLYPKSVEQAEAVLINPLKSSNYSQELSAGKTLFSDFCAVCHGIHGKGDGTVVHKFPRPPDLISETYKKRKDGLFFHTITFGSALMPGYGHALSVNERWQIVLYLRSLQEIGGHESK